MEKILVSACLMGEPVRYDGKSLLQEDALFQQWQAQQRLVMVCPEVAGGLNTPRDPAEIICHDTTAQGFPPTNIASLSGQGVLQGKARVQTNTGEDVSQAFISGAQLALNICQQQNIHFALLSARSPSCGNEKIYSGQFNGQLIDGQGVTAALLSQHGIQVFNQFQLPLLANALKN